jgi:hypothetical protein
MRLSTLTLRFVTTSNGGPDYPAVQILIDGREAFVDHLPHWHGFDPDRILAQPSPLLPADPGRRIALYMCACGSSGCGSISARIVASAGGNLVSWEDFRDVGDDLDGPTAPDAGGYDGRPLPFPDLHFAYDRYVTEIDRATADRSWETSPRVTARLVADGLRARDVVLHPDLRLAWTAPTSDPPAVMISFAAGDRYRHDGQRVLVVPADTADPERGARQVLDRLGEIPPEDWAQRYPWRVPGR